MIKNQALIDSGYLLTEFPLDPVVLNFLQEENWKALDQHFLEISKSNGTLRNFLMQFLDFETLEHIIAIRKAPLDDEGIWHDDGSRFLGFSLSLNRKPKAIEGGVLNFRRKESKDMVSFSPLPYGKIVLFLSGIYGYEHQVSAVTKGERIIIAGWCS